MRSLIKHLYIHLLLIITFSSFSISENDPNLINSSILRRSTYSGDGTFYAVGLGACGYVNNDGQMVAALPAEQFDHLTKKRACGSTAVVHRGSRRIVVRIVDRCAGCKVGDIDLSPDAFSGLAEPVEGRVHVTYSLKTR
ncbi:27126_t:CDS:1, partial [Racocetra persica]